MSVLSLLAYASAIGVQVADFSTIADIVVTLAVTLADFRLNFYCYLAGGNLLLSIIACLTLPAIQ